MYFSTDKQHKLKIASLFFLCGIGVIFVLFIINNQTYDKLQFSEVIHKDQRQFLFENLNEAMTYFSVEEQKVIIQIARYDLNDDGIKDAFIQLLGPELESSGGNPIYIFQVDSKGKWHTIWEVSTRGEFWIKKTKSKGFHDFIRIGPDSHFPLYLDFVSEYEWVEGKYDYVGSRPLTKQEEETFYGKNL